MTRFDTACRALVSLAIALFATSETRCLAGNEITCPLDAIDKDSGYVVATDASGNFSRLGKYQRALDDPAARKSLTPEMIVKARNCRGYIYYVMHKTDKAVGELDQALAIDPNNVSSLYLRAVSYESSGQWQKDIADCDRLIELDPQTAVFYYHRAVAYARLKQYQKAVDDCTRAIALKPKFANAYSFRGAAYEELGKHDLAAKDRETGEILGRAER